MWLLISTAIVLLASGSPVSPADIQIQEDFDEGRLYGKWYTIALGTTCKWMRKYKDQYRTGTLVVAPGETSEELLVTSTAVRQGVCSQVARNYQKTSIPGKYRDYNSKWQTSVESYVARTNYDEYAILARTKNSSYGFTITAQLYGRNPELHEDRVEEFRQFALDLGIPEDSIFRLIRTGECVPSQPEHSQQRDRRSAWEDEEGSSDGPSPFADGNREDFCLQPRDAGPCLGMLPRYFFNTTSQNCESFFYGGCRGNANNFRSERRCLQTCRTEAACRLPIDLGSGSCQTEFWAFDANPGICVTFQGCGGNANKFYLQKECQEYCGAVFAADLEEFLRSPPS